MTRSGVVIVSSDEAATNFLQTVLEGHARTDAPAVVYAEGKSCLASLAGSQRRRLVVVDGKPPDVSVANLVETIRVVDPHIPIVLVRPLESSSEGAADACVGIYIINGPLAGTSAECTLVDALQPYPIRGSHENKGEPR